MKKLLLLILLIPSLVFASPYNGGPVSGGGGGGSGGMVYPGLGIPQSTGAAWGVSIVSSADVQTFLGYADFAAMKAGLSIDDLVTLSGAADGAVHLGAFTGSTITDNQTIKSALQLLETAIEGVGGGHDALTLSGTPMTDVFSLSTQAMSLDTQTANYIFAGPATGEAAAPTFRAMVDADIPSAIARDTELHAAVTLGSGIGGLTLSTQELGLSARLEAYHDYTDPNADRIWFWDDSEGAFGGLTVGNSIAITTTTIDSIQDIRTTATPQFARLGLGQAADGTNPLSSSGFSVDPDGDLVAKSLTATKASGVAGDISAYEANSTDTHGAGFRGPASITGDGAYRILFPNARASAANSVLAVTNAGESGTGTAADPYIQTGSWITPVLVDGALGTPSFTALNLPSSDASPSTTAGQLRHDSTVTGLLTGALAWWDGDEVRYVVDLDALPSDDDYVVAYDADDDKFYMKADATGVGGSGSVTTLKEATSQVGGADIVTIDFGAGFDLSEDPDTEINITFDPTEITVWDLGGATSFELPNSDDPDVDAAGEVSWDTDGWLRAYDGTNQVAIARKIEPISVTVVKPNDLPDAVRDAFPIWENVSGMSFVVTGWSAKSSTDDTTLNIEETDADGQNNATVDAVEIATNGTGLYYSSDTTITAATIETGHMIWLDFDDTDDPSWVKLTIYGYYNADVN